MFIIPIGDDKPREQFPIITVILIILNCLAFFYFAWIQGNYQFIVEEYGFVPLRGTLMTMLTSMFLHADIFHLVWNMLYLWIYGDHVESKFGRIPFLFFYFIFGIIALQIQAMFMSNPEMPVIGASGAIAGVLGAYMVLFPKAHIRFWYFAIILFRIYSGTFKVVAWLVLGFWFAQQLIFGHLDLNTTGLSEGGVAFFAHIGGFLCGLIVMLCYRQYYAIRRYSLLEPLFNDFQIQSLNNSSRDNKDLKKIQKLINHTITQHGTLDGVKLYEQMLTRYPDGTADPASLLRIAESYTRREEYNKAVQTYKRLIWFYPHSNKADNALWLLAQLYQDKLNQREYSNQCLRLLVKGYPLSEWYAPANFVIS